MELRKNSSCEIIWWFTWINLRFIIDTCIVIVVLLLFRLYFEKDFIKDVIFFTKYVRGNCRTLSQSLHSSTSNL